MSLETILSFFVLMLISIGTYFVSRRIRVPYTVLLVLVGSLLVPLTHVEFFAFLKAFRLTPELLFYLFLPILIFESAYNMRVRDLMQNVRAVSWFSVGSLVISM
jgi:CPA1 family monovalent cation:H+ antiporter